VALLAPVVSWACYGLLALTLADGEAQRCHDFGRLAAECSAPFLVILLAVSAVFV
jgi:hypothetical protein